MKYLQLTIVNGLTVDKLSYNQSVGIVTCTLVTPILGFSTAPFSVNEVNICWGSTKRDIC